MEFTECNQHLAHNALLKGYQSYCDIDSQEEFNVPIYYMTLEEQLEREQLNSLNTASALRARVVAELSKSNGHSNGPSVSLSQ